MPKPLSQGIRGLQIDGQLELARLLHRQFSGVGSLEELVDVTGGARQMTTLQEIVACIRAEAQAKCRAALADAGRLIAHLPPDERAVLLADMRAALDAQLATLDREWAAVEHLEASGQLPADQGAWREAIAFAAAPREPKDHVH